jgi:hypothetical protein
LYWNKVIRPPDQIDRAVSVQPLPVSDQVGVSRPVAIHRPTNIWVQGLSLSVGFSY